MFLRAIKRSQDRSQTPTRRSNGRSSRLRFIVSAIAATTTVLAAAPLASPAYAEETPQPVVSDSFTRTVADGWGSAAEGKAYRSVASDVGSLSVDGKTATVSLAAGQAAESTLGDTVAGDVRAEASVKFATLGGAAYHAFVLRSQSDGSAYRARVYVNDEGVPFLGLTRVSGGNEESLAREKLGSSPVDPNAWYRVAFTVTGTNPVRVEASLTPGATAASTPNLTYSDSSSARISKPGGVGFWSYASSGSSEVSTLKLDDLAFYDGAQALSQGASATPPTDTPAAPAPVVPNTPVEDAVGAVGPSAPAGQMGSASVGSAAYAVPSGALFVDPAAKAGGNGKIGTPFASVQAAVNAAKAGGTIVLRGGTYHQSVEIPGTKPLTIQAYPKEAVWFDGSVPVTNWTKSGNVWVSSGWKARFSSDILGQTSRFVHADYPNAALPDQLFVDGASVAQVASAAAVKPGTFAVDYATGRLILGSDPTGRAVRASDLSQAINSIAPNTTLQGFGVRRYATQYKDKGAVRLQNVKSTARDLVITDNSMWGLSMTNNDDLAERITVQRNGMLGLAVNAAYNFVLRNSNISQNNTERFKIAPVAGGVKITKSRNVTISNNNISGNYATGLWFDQSNYNMNIVNNIVNDNKSNNSKVSNVEIEISDTGVIAGNQMLGGDIGLYVLSSGNLRVFNNDFGGNTFMSVQLIQDHRRQAVADGDTDGQRDPRRPAVDPTVPWITKNITLSNNVFAGASGGQFTIYTLDRNTKRAVDTWNLVINGNLFVNRAAGGPQMVAWGLGDNKSQEKYHTPEALAAAKNKAWKNAMTSGAPTTIGQMAGDIATASKSVTVPLPGDIAGLIGASANSRILGSLW